MQARKTWLEGHRYGSAAQCVDQSRVMGGAGGVIISALHTRFSLL